MLRVFLILTEGGCSRQFADFPYQVWFVSKETERNILQRASSWGHWQAIPLLPFCSSKENRYGTYM